MGESLQTRVEKLGGKITRTETRHRVTYTTKDANGVVVATSLSSAWAWVKATEQKETPE